MTSGRVSGGPSRGSDAPTRTTWTRDGLGAIAAVLALGFVFRLIIVQVNPGSGFKTDIDSFTAWAGNLASQGMGGFYQRPGFLDYTPGYLYVLYAIGVVGRITGNIGDLIKIPPILADVAIGWLVWSMIRELGGGRRAALLGAAIAVANPVSWFDSVVWGQVDSFGVVFLLLGVRALWRDQPERAAIYAVVAALIKPQLGILAPIVAVVTIRRALWPDPEAAAELPSPDDIHAAPSLLERIRLRERRTNQPIRILTTAVAGFLTAVALCWPFGLSVIDAPRTGEIVHSGLMEQVFKTAGGYPYASVNAYNPWALASVDGNGVAANGTWACDTVIANPQPGRECPEAVTIGPFPAVYVGAALLIAAFLVTSLVVLRRPDRLTILIAVTVLAVAFFMLPTRVHERYLFPLVAVGAILAGVSFRWLAAYAVLSGLTFLNMYVVLTTIYTNNYRIRDWFHIGSTVRSPTAVTLIVLAGIAATIWAFSQLRRGGERALADEIAGTADDAPRGRWSDEAPPSARGLAADAWPPAEPARSSAAAAGPVATAASASRGAVLTGPEPAPLPTWSPPPSFAELGPIGWFRARLDQRPTQADRSRALHDEPGGRFDKLDLWILCVLVAAILGTRLFRLSEPYQMHFDEVYHARTATEFLQNWRYGLNHYIYEYTHPHLAKYAMAGGLVAWGDDRVTASSEIGTPVIDAVVERLAPDPDDPGRTIGDRVDVVTGSELRSYDLTTRKLITSQPIAGAAAIALDATNHQLVVGTSDGSLWTFDVGSLDAARAQNAPALIAEPLLLGQVGAPIRRLFVPADGTAIVATTDDDRVLVVDPATAETRATIQLHGIADLAEGGNAPTLVSPPGAASNPAAAATIAEILGGDAATYEARLSTTQGSDLGRLVIAGVDDAQARTDLQKAIDDGRLTGMSIDSLPRLAVADTNGVQLITTEGGFVAQTVDVGAPARGLANVNVDSENLYVATDPDPAVDEEGRIAKVAIGGDQAKNGATLVSSMAMPGEVSRVAYDDATEMVHVLGRTPAGDAATIYVIEPHGDAVYADAELPFEPSAWAIDVNRADPTDDRQQILVFDAAGEVASVDVGMHEFAWRLPGVLAGTIMAAFLYLLARILFRRRSIALIVGLLTVADGMLFVQSRIGMNDAYVGAGIVVAYTLFAALWTGAWRHRGAFWIGMPLIGLALGLALASKWVALYAIVGIGFLVLARSALGRLLSILLLILMTTVLGYLAINVPAGTGFGNLPFVALMVGLTVIAVITNVTHPIRWSIDETRFAIGTPVVVGAVLIGASIVLGKASAALKVGSLTLNPLEIGLAVALLGALVWLVFVAAARVGFGPFAPPPGPDEPAALLAPASAPPAAAWLRPGAQLGLPVVWMLACLLLLPVVVYVISYIPWALVDNHLILPGSGPLHVGAWPPGHTGQTLTDLTGAMYAYHNDLASPHAASSPWWAWLFDLKPVWFYQESLAGNTTAAIYDAGNIVIWWLGLPALLFVSWQAYARRSLPLALVAIGYAFQWVSWARIDRAAFQYHYYTSLPFLVLALAYFLAELWHGASRRTWLLARLAAAAAIIGPAATWVMARPLCAAVDVQRAVPNSVACAPTIPQFVLTSQTAAIALILGVAILVVARLFGRLGEDRIDDREVLVGGLRLSDSTLTLGLLGLTAAVSIALATVVRAWLGDGDLIRITSVPVEPVALVFTAVAVVIAAFVATVRDARRFVAGVLVAVVAWFVAVYPNFSGLPLPTAIANVYQGVLPTYLYYFQFPVNNSAAKVPIELFSATPAILLGSVVFLAAVVGYSAWVWRLAVAERLAEDEGLRPGPGIAADPGSGGVGD
ncbi:MAG TPA: phospholipid carrier-dependent glycosyltransferase [Candidatus Limnocylindrales bacterium]|nr:phospholipid carrier-dependent glycosyltransferase [Candidatus Limnocylindrales bacterium]